MLFCSKEVFARSEEGVGRQPNVFLMQKPFWQSSQGAKRYLTGEFPECSI